jgi:hypothetical protein
MKALQRAQAAARTLIPWWAAGAELGIPGHTAPVVLRAMWRTLRRETPERRYERRILRRMARGDLTNTLGIHIRDEAHIRATSEEWLTNLVTLGLRPDSLCVEYGCGSLWCAEPVIRYLQPGRFIGLDITDRFYELGRQRLYELASEKQVGLAKISRTSLREVAALNPDFVYSHRVIHHVPRRALTRYVRRITALLNQRTILVIENCRRYNGEDIRPHLPQDWLCRQEAFGLVITHRDRSLPG